MRSSCKLGRFLLQRRIILAHRAQAAFFAFGMAGHADVAAVQDKPVMGFVHEVAGNEFQQLLFGGQRRFGIDGKPYAGGDTEDMGIDGHIGLLIDDGGDDIGGFAAHAGQLHQLVDGHGHLAMKFVHQHIGHTDEVFGLVVGIGNASYQGKQLVEAGPGQVGGVGIALKQGGSGHIDPLVGTLGRKDDGYEQLVGIVVQQLRLGIGGMVLKIVDYKAVAFFPGHGANRPRI